MTHPADSPAQPFYDSTGAPVGMPHSVLPSAAAIVFDAGGNLLLQKREDNGFWGLPGGRTDPGESISTTCAREVWEETGFRVRVGRLVGIYSDPTLFNIGRYKDGNIVQYVNCLFECEITGGEMALSDESTDIGFFPVDALPEPLLASHKIRIADALARRAEVFVR